MPFNVIRQDSVSIGISHRIQHLIFCHASCYSLDDVYPIAPLYLDYDPNMLILPGTLIGKEEVFDSVVEISDENARIYFLQEQHRQ